MPFGVGRKREAKSLYCRVLSPALQEIYDVEVEDMATIDRFHLILCTPELMYNSEFFSILSLKKAIWVTSSK